jgi:Reverse transcriptase (RNA-dependent DNA polymerase)
MLDIPLILEKLSGCRVLTKLELKDADYHVLMNKESKKRMGFTCKYGTFKYRVIPFGLKNAPLVFQRLMDPLLLPFERETVHSYLDGIITGSMTLDEILNLVRRVIEHLIKKDKHSSLKKCSFYSTEVEFLNHVVTKMKRKIHKKNIKLYQTMDAHIQLKSWPDS